MTSDEAAAYLRVGRRTLDRWVSESLVRAYELPVPRGRRFKRQDLDELLVQPTLGLADLQPRMAEVAVFNGGNHEFQEIAVMVRDASVNLGQWPRQIVERSLARAEASNSAKTFRGRLIRQARIALLDWLDRRDSRSQ